MRRLIYYVDNYYYFVKIRKLHKLLNSSITCLTISILAVSKDTFWWFIWSRCTHNMSSSQRETISILIRFLYHFPSIHIKVSYIIWFGATSYCHWYFSTSLYCRAYCIWNCPGLWSCSCYTGWKYFKFKSCWNTLFKSIAKFFCHWFRRWCSTAFGKSCWYILTRCN